MRWLRWIEPFGPNGEPVYCLCSEETAIAVAKQVARQSNFTYQNDNQALEDFMTVHWADLYEDEKGHKRASRFRNAISVTATFNEAGFDFYPSDMAEEGDK